MKPVSPERALVSTKRPRCRGGVLPEEDEGGESEPEKEPEEAADRPRRKRSSSITAAEMEGMRRPRTGGPGEGLGMKAWKRLCLRSASRGRRGDEGVTLDDAVRILRVTGKSEGMTVLSSEIEVSFGRGD